MLFASRSVCLGRTLLPGTRPPLWLMESLTVSLRLIPLVLDRTADHLRSPPPETDGRTGEGHRREIHRREGVQRHYAWAISYLGNGEDGRGGGGRPPLEDVISPSSLLPQTRETQPRLPIPNNRLLIDPLLMIKTALFRVESGSFSENLVAEDSRGSSSDGIHASSTHTSSSPQVETTGRGGRDTFEGFGEGVSLADELDDVAKTEEALHDPLTDMIRWAALLVRETHWRVITMSCTRIFMPFPPLPPQLGNTSIPRNTWNDLFRAQLEEYPYPYVVTNSTMPCAPSAILSEPVVIKVECSLPPEDLCLEGSVPSDWAGCSIVCRRRDILGWRESPSSLPTTFHLSGISRGRDGKCESFDTRSGPSNSRQDFQSCLCGWFGCW